MDLVVVSGYTGSGKSTVAAAVADAIGATVVSFDWLMSALRSVPEVWAVTELPVERQRAVGWLLLGRVAEQQLRRGASCVLDLVARPEAVAAWHDLARRYDARFTVVECQCSDAELHLARVAGRRRDIPGWYELSADDVTRSRSRYEPLPVDDKVVIDAVDPLDENVARVLRATGRPSRHRSAPAMDHAVPAGTESVRPFLPAKDFAVSKAFYEALGFTIELDADDVAIYRVGATSFLLQRYFQQEWAENFMMQLMVDDLDAWWARIVSLDLSGRFGVPAPKAPAVQPWGLRIAYVVDPSGVLWHVAQRRPDVAHDR